MIALFTHQARFILAIGLLLGQVIRVSSQGTVAASDLPSCADSCASTASIAAGCTLTDTACLCSHPTFADATRSCASSACTIEDRSSVNGVLNDMCSATSPSNTSSPAPLSTSGSATPPSQTSRSGSASQGTNSPNSSANSTGTAASNTPSAPVGTNSTVSSQSQSSTSTALVVQTVVLPQSTNFSGAVSREFGIVGLGLVGQAVIALVGGVWLLL